jgi:hypothetical protein
MFRFQRHLRQLFLPLALVGVHAFSSEALGQKAEETLKYSPPTVVLNADRTVVDAGEAALVQLTARATSPDNNPIRYNWRVTGGTIEGEGAAVAWRLVGVAPGQHKASLVINTGKGTELCEAMAFTLVTVKALAPKPTCPTVGITCPEQIKTGQPVTFTSNLSGGTGNVPSIYNWTISAGRIISGQGTSSITVDTAGLGGHSLKASLTMGGYEVDCAASCTIELPIPLIARKFDEYPDISRNDEKARLDNFAIELQNDPTATGYVLIYPERGVRSAKAQTRSTNIIDYLVNSRGIDSRRLVSLVGPQRDNLMVELWVSPQGAPAPKP